MKLRYRLFSFLALAIFLPTLALAQRPNIRVQTFPTNKIQFKFLIQSNMDVVHVHDLDVELLATESELARIQAMGIPTHIINPNVYGVTSGGNWLPEYMSYSEVETALANLAATYPAITELTVIGTSIEGRNLYALKISDNASSDENEPEVLIVGNHHAREVITPIICVHVATELLEGYGSDSNYTEWVDNREIWIVPVLNPDGLVYVETVDLFWRKNRRNNPGNDEGVDLNRNWAYEWGHDDNGSSGSYRSAVYRGASPASEPEVSSLLDFVNTREFKVAMTFHSFGNLLLWGPGYKPADGVDQDVHAGFGDVITSQNGYSPGNPASGNIYLTNGDATDWLYHVAGIYAFTPEVGTSNDYFNPPASRIPTLIVEGSICAWEAIRYADRPEQLAPPGQPTLNSIPNNSGTYDVTWNAPESADIEVVEYELVEKTGPSIVSDGAENGADNFDLGGWSVSPTRSESGSFSFYGGNADRLNNICLTKEGYVVQAGDLFSFDAWWNLENEWDYAYAILSTDGGRSYQPLAGSFTTLNDPNGRNADHGITGNSNGWRSMTFDLADYVGQTVWLGFRYSTDGGSTGPGIWIDNVHPVQAWASSNVLSSNIAGTTYSVELQPEGTYYYTVRGRDAENDWGYVSGYVSTAVSEPSVVPDSFWVTLGSSTSGGVVELAESDDQYLALAPEFLSFRYQLEFTVDATAPAESPSGLEFSYESRALNVFGTVEQEIELFNYDLGQFESVDTRLTSTVDTVVSVTPNGDPTRFVEAGTNEMQARIRYENSLPFWVFSARNLYLPYRVRADHIFWTITP